MWESVPASIRGLDIWLIWKRGSTKPTGKFDKIPHYVGGGVRQGRQGSDTDRAKLVKFDAAVSAAPNDGGVGIAMLDGYEITVLDCDNCIDDRGEVAEWASEITKGTYTEISPSGKGLRALFWGKSFDAKNIEKGFEVFCAKGFVTITGNRTSEEQELINLSADRLRDIKILVGKVKDPRPEKSESKFRRVARHPTSKILEALKFLNPDDRDHWIKVGWALSREFEQSDEGFAIFNQWAAQSSKYNKPSNQEEMRHEYYESAKKDRDSKITIATVFYLATQSGWKEGPVSLEDFWAYLPTHQYMHRATRALWPAASVDSSVVPWPHKDEKRMAPSAYLDQTRAVEQATWTPAGGEIIEDRVSFEGGWIPKPGARVFNLYRPPPTLAAGASTNPDRWRDHLRAIYPESADHLESWLAHRIQSPGTKINHAIVLGGEQGIGKDSILEPIKLGIGHWNWREISPIQMLGRFNGWIKAVVVRVSEIRDMGDVDRFTFYDHSKAYITSPPDVITCDEKHIREHPVHNVAGFIFTTNHKTAGMFLPPDDRRHYVAWSDSTRDEFDSEYWEGYWSWLLEGGGSYSVVEYLRHKDLKGFNPKAPPPQTEAWWAIVHANSSPEEEELSGVFNKLGSPRAITIQQVIDCAKVMNEDSLSLTLEDRKNRRRIPHMMERSGYVIVRNPGAEKTSGYWTVWGRQTSVYVLKSLSYREQIEAAQTLVNSPKPF